MADDGKSVAQKEPENGSEMASNSPEGESEDVFEVEKIIGMTKTKGKKTLYRVRWLGYGPDHDTWEPYENLHSCRPMVDKYIKNEEKKKKDKVKKKVSVDVIPDPAPTPTTSSSNKKAPTWKYVTADQEEFDTLKDKFWRDLEQGRVDVFQAGDMYSKVKACGRASRPKSFTEMFQNKLPVSDETQPRRPQTATRGKSSKGCSGQNKGKRPKSVSTPDSESSVSTIGSSSRVPLVNKARRGRGTRTQRGSRCSTASSLTQSYSYEHSQTIDNMDTTSVGSCETVSSMDTQSVAMSEDSSHSYEVDSRHGYEVQVKEDIVGILPMSGGQSPGHSSCFSQISLEREPKTEGACRGKPVLCVSPCTASSSCPSRTLADTTDTNTSDAQVGACHLDGSPTQTQSTDSKMYACCVLLQPLPKKLLKKTATKVECTESVTDQRASDCVITGQIGRVGQTGNAPLDNSCDNVPVVDNGTNTYEGVSPGLYVPVVGTDQADSDADMLVIRTPASIDSGVECKLIDDNACTLSVDLPHRTDCTTAPNSVASSATSASSANESGIVADSGSQVNTPKDCSDLGDNVEVIDLDHSLHRKRKLDSLATDDSKRGLNEACFSESLRDDYMESVDVRRMGRRQPTSECKTTHGSIPQTSRTETHLSSSAHSEQQSSTDADPLCTADISSTQGPGGPDPYPVSQAYTTYMNQTTGSDFPSTLGLPDDLGSDLMPLNQIQPTIGNLMSDKSILNNNKGETGDEEYEFDLEDMDPSEWEGKIAPKMALPDVLEMSNAELRQLVQINDYERLVRALRAKKMYDLEQPDQTGMTLAMIASQHGYDDTLELLMLRGANMNSEQKNGTTALMLACEQGLRCTVALLLEMGSHMNKHNHSGETALIKAVKCSHKHVVKLLLDHGANFASPFNIDTPLRWARHQRDILDLLNAHISRLKAEFEHQVQITLNNTAHIICALFPMQCFALREADKLKVIFKHELQPTKPGVGMLLFIGHACITQQEVRCRFYGPCAVQSAVLNGVQLGPLTEEGNFVMSFCPLHNGKNELDILTAKAPTSKAKLVVCAYKAQLI